MSSNFDCKQNNFHYGHNIESIDNPFNDFGAVYDPYHPKTYNKFFEQKKNNVYDYSNKEVIYTNLEQNNFLLNERRIGRKTNPAVNFITNTYNIAQDSLFNQDFIPTHVYENYPQRVDHISEILNYGYRENTAGYSVIQNGNKNNNNIINKIKVPSCARAPEPGEVRDINNNNAFIPNINKDKETQKEKKSYLDLFPQYKVSNINPYKSVYANLLAKRQNFKPGEKPNPENKTEFFVDNCSSIINYAYKEDQNSKYCNYMEDKGIAIDCFNGDPSSGLFCLFDGHGGSEVSTYLQNIFPNMLKNILPFKKSLAQEFINLFNSIDTKFKEMNFYNTGSTATIVYITIENGKRVLYCINLGDSRCILLSNNVLKKLSFDHKVSDPSEYERIMKNGGVIVQGRVGGQLLISRAFGDSGLKSFGVSCEPFISRTEIGGGDKFVVIASDGVWDVVEDRDILNIISGCDNSWDICQRIVKEAIDKGSNDNISCFVIGLN